MSFQPTAADAVLLAEALELDRDSLIWASREPLGAGSVLGVDLVQAEASLRYYLDTSRLAVEEETGLLLGSPQDPEARIWLHPADPHLPALAAVAFGHAAESLLARLGERTTGDPEIIAYRPGRRAVLRVPVGDGHVWVKVVRPSRVERIVTAHRAFATAGLPVPELLGWSGEGLVVLADAQGTPASEVDWEPSSFLDEIDRLRERVRAVRIDTPVRGVGTRLDWYAERVKRIPSAQAVINAVRGAEASMGGDGSACVHGDLHFGQLFLGSDGAVVGLIDVDTAGRGPRAEDSAAFTGHACASAVLTDPARAGRVWALADAAYGRWQHEPGMPSFTAIHLLGHALAAADADRSDDARILVDAAAAVMVGRAPSSACGT